MILGYFLRACFLTCTEVILYQTFQYAQEIITFWKRFFTVLLSVPLSWFYDLGAAMMNFREAEKAMRENIEIQEVANRATAIMFATITVFSTLFISLQSHFFATIIPEQEWIPLLILVSILIFDTPLVHQVIDRPQFITGLKKESEDIENPSLWQVVKRVDAEKMLQYLYPRISANPEQTCVQIQDSLFFYTICMAGIVQEIIFRWILISFLQGIIGFPIWLCGGMSMILFAFTNQRGKRFYIFLVSALFLFSYLISGTYLAIFVHLLFNLTVDFRNIKPHIWIAVILQAFLMWGLGV